jgi:lipopolysaccharide export system protein LptA
MFKNIWMHFLLKKRKFRLILAFFCSFPTIFLAQTSLSVTPPDTAVGRLHVEYSEFGEMILKGANTVEKFSGSVRLRQDNTLMYADTVLKTGEDARAWGHVIIQQGDTVKIFADSSIYFGAIRQADLFGDVVLKNGRQELFTTKLHYDLANKVANYENNATMSNGKTQIKSRRGKYFVNEKSAFFEKDVVVTDPEFTVRTDSIKFNTETQVATFLAPTLISQKDSKIYTEAGFFETDINYAEFTKNPQFIKGDQKGQSTTMRYDGKTHNFFLEGAAKIEEGIKIARADTILYGEEEKLTILRGHAFYQDSTQNIEADNIRYDDIQKSYNISGRTRVSNPPNIILGDKLNFNDLLGEGFVEGNVIWQDTAAKMAIRCQRMDYNKKTDYLLAVGGEGDRTRPLLSIPMDGDTLWLACDTLHSFRRQKRDSLDVDTARILTGHYDVRIFKKDLQAVCDSLSFDANDSLFVFYKNPIMWSDSSQFTADTIKMAMKNGQIEQMLLRQNAFIISQPEPDTSIQNQIRGKNCTAFFKNRKVNRLNVEGNSEAVYWIKDDDDAYLGVNKTASPTMNILFGDGKVEGIRFYGPSTGKFSPMKEVKSNISALNLDKKPTFLWRSPKRPQSIEDLDGEIGIF